VGLGLSFCVVQCTGASAGIRSIWHADRSPTGIARHHILNCGPSCHQILTQIRQQTYRFSSWSLLNKVLTLINYLWRVLLYFFIADISSGFLGLVYTIKPDGFLRYVTKCPSPAQMSVCVVCWCCHSSVGGKVLRDRLWVHARGGAVSGRGGVYAVWGRHSGVEHGQRHQSWVS